MIILPHHYCSAFFGLNLNKFGLVEIINLRYDGSLVYILRVYAFVFPPNYFVFQIISDVIKICSVFNNGLHRLIESNFEFNEFMALKDIP